MTIRCENACSLVPSYLDGELSEEQAGPLRRHLLDCQACREVAQGGQALTRWFVDEEHVAVPSGFASRVARRAFAGDTGTRPDVGEPTPSIEGSVLPFVLHMTAVAAAVLFVFALGIRQQDLPEDPGLSAESSWQDVRIELDKLNAEDEDEGEAEAKDAE